MMLSLVCIIIPMMFMFILNPLGVGILLFFFSVMIALKMSSMVSAWYAYMLFLIFVGGLLVMFIYVCMVSSNYQLNMIFNYWSLAFLMMCVFVFFDYDMNQKMQLFNNESISGTSMPMLILLLLGVYLLLGFLVVLCVIFSGGTILKLND
uniref:NADH dehydrogenase subunit 6 n=1 Tax=Ryssota otaheitana TaxID=2595071 RepID=A0A5B8G357_9EUPU|nr:NADH dehydrogenase subunit 6 [Ryssota otaheitana]QDM39453.1 NADH dehydrogenase subunit 6 [Ryssota otaheitana]